MPIIIPVPLAGCVAWKTNRQAATPTGAALSQEASSQPVIRTSAPLTGSAQRTAWIL